MIDHPTLCKEVLTPDELEWITDAIQILYRHCNEYGVCFNCATASLFVAMGIVSAERSPMGTPMLMGVAGVAAAYDRVPVRIEIEFEGGDVHHWTKGDRQEDERKLT